jgi:hypothetical protein
MEDSRVTQSEVAPPVVMKPGNGCLKAAIAAAIVILALVAGLWFLGDRLWREFNRGLNPETVAQASLQGLREQNRLSTFAARYVAVVTSKQNRLGLVAQKTMIMPGNVRYEVDLSKLRQQDVTWDAATNRLSVVLPALEVVGPDVDINAIRQYDNGGILLSLTDVGGQLDDANRKAGQAELVRQAREAVPMKLARDATRNAIERSFAMPLRAAGIDASVEVRFPDEASGPRERWDESRRPEDVVANKW